MADGFLAPVGLGEVESALYLHLLSAPRSTAAQLAVLDGSTAARLRPALARLADAGLITRLTGSPVRYVASPPEAAVGSLASRRERELEELRAHVRALALRLKGEGANHPSELVELVEGREAQLNRVEQMQLGSEEEMQVIDCPPYFSSPTFNPIEFELLRRGISCRVIYDSVSLEGRMPFVQDCIDAGEQARSLPAVRMKMLIADRRAAMIPLNFEATESMAALFVHPSPLLTALVTCFDLLWERATPLAVDKKGAAGQLAPADQELLSMLAAGMKDATITRALGITQRTMTRRVAHLLEALDAKTRFQAGLQAAKRGWL
ncbi:helix-turn-helix domain-containing protein [Streptomyces sp. NPDC006733]|uniref:helix-turn-helix domain-containing protein n=1 Tax=Streptomyces sp. NPDC006733 TaxID=3155460 RepID=UPI0033EDE9FA